MELMELNERITALENDFTVTKGEIKKLLIDIREMMNNLENPFYNVEELTAKMRERVEGIGIEKEKEKERKDVEMQEREEKSEVEAEAETEDLAKIGAEEERENVPEPEDKEKLELTMEREAGHKKEDKEAIKSVIGDVKGFDLFTIAELMKWSDYALGTIGRAKINDLVDIFGLTRHISDDMKRIILKISDLTSSDAEGKEKEKEINVDMRDCIISLYQLNRIVNPDDRSMDSVMLSMYLRGEDTAWKV